jgi:hypothetical protein
VASDEGSAPGLKRATSCSWVVEGLEDDCNSPSERLSPVAGCAGSITVLGVSLEWRESFGSRNTATEYMIGFHSTRANAHDAGL